MAKPKNIDEYLATLNPDQRGALQKLRQTIKAAAPKAEECMSYSLPAFRQDGVLVCFRAAANHCALHPMNGTIVDQFKKALKKYSTSKGTIRFQPDQPLPATLVRKLVKARVAENQLRKAKRK